MPWRNSISPDLSSLADIPVSAAARAASIISAFEKVLALLTPHLLALRLRGLLILHAWVFGLQLRILQRSQFQVAMLQGQNVDEL